MADAQRFTLYGGVGSPYSCKVRSFLRYKRIPFDWTPALFAMGQWPEKFRHIRPKVIPVLVFPNGFSMNESTKIFEKIEETYCDRSIFIKNNKCNQFISDLLEDFADEWCTKLMYGMRWNRPIDQDFGSTFITYKAPFEMRKYVKNTATKRQVERRKIVGCDNDNEIHASFNEICAIFEAFLKNNYFLFGKVPTNADFAFYGQMRQFAVDMTSNAILRETYPLIFCWLYKMDDLSGVQNNNKQSFKISNAVIELLKICGNVYLPFLAANNEAIKNKQKMFNVNLLIHGKIFNHKQKSFKWQSKCLQTLKNKFNALKSDPGFHELKATLQKTNCWSVLASDTVSKL